MTICIPTPRTAPAAQVRPVMNRFCFQEGLARHRTARPTPAPVPHGFYVGSSNSCSSPIPSTSRPKARLKAKMKRKISMVWRRAARHRGC